MSEPHDDELAEPGEAERYEDYQPPGEPGEDYPGDEAATDDDRTGGEHP